MSTRVVNIHTDDFDFYIGRAGRGYDGYFGNPFADGSREQNIERFKTYFMERVQHEQDFRERALAMRECRLGCFCAPQPCHGHIIAAWIDAQPLIVNSFTGRFFWLSNFALSPFKWVDIEWPTVEHAYQAAKASNHTDMLNVSRCLTPGEAKRMGRRLAIRPDWESVKLPMMRGLLALKFASGSNMAGQLVGTGDTLLVEGNHWGDTFWGVCRGVGENWLGRLLMELRFELRQATSSCP